MLSDDLTALAAISIGALASAGVTFAAVAGYDDRPEPVRVRAEAQAVTAPEGASGPRASVIVDFAIIRERGDVMVGPERPSTGWDAPQLELRYRRSR